MIHDRHAGPDPVLTLTVKSVLPAPFTTKPVLGQVELSVSRVSVHCPVKAFGRHAVLATGDLALSDIQPARILRMAKHKSLRRDAKKEKKGAKGNEAIILPKMPSSQIERADLPDYISIINRDMMEALGCGF